MFIPKVDPLVVAEFPVGHVTMVPDDLADMLGWHVLLLSIHKAKLPLLGVPLRLQLLPFSSYGIVLVHNKSKLGHI